MNNIQLKVKLTSVNTEYVGQDAKICTSGHAKYQFYSNGKMNTRSMAYRTYGKSALALKEAGVNSVHVISGSLNIYPPNDQNPNHAMLLTIKQSVPVAVTKAPATSMVQPIQPVVQPQQPVATQPVPQSTAQPQSSVDNLDKIPF